MSQVVFPSIVPTITSGTQLAQILNDFKDAIISGFSGTTRPSEIDPGGYWIDTSGGTLWQYKIFDGFQDITIFTLNTATGTASIASADSLFKVEKISADAVGPILQLVKERIASAGQVFDGDTVGEIQFLGTTDIGTNVVQAQIEAVSTDNVTNAARGAYLVFQVAPDATSGLVEVMRLVNNRVGIGTATPSDVLHVEGNARVSLEVDSAVGPKAVLAKSRVTGLGGVLSGDVLGAVEFKSKADTGEEIATALLQVEASQNHTLLAQGTRVSFQYKRNNSAIFKEEMFIDDAGVNIDRLIVNSLQATIDGQTIVDSSIETPTRLDVKQGVEAALTTYALTASDGQLCFATDTQVMYQIVDNELVPLGAGGGGVSLKWNKDTNAPVTEYVDGFELESFSNLESNELYATLIVPASYRPGKPIKLVGAQFFCASTTGNVFFKAQTALVNSGLVLGSYPNLHNSTNAQVTVPGVSNTLASVGEVDLTDSLGRINLVTVNPGDKLRIRFFRDTANETLTAAAPARLIADAVEPAFS